MLCFSGARTLVSLWYQGIGEVGFLRECTRHVYTFLGIYTKYTLTKYGFWGGGAPLSRYQPHPLSRLPFHAFNVVLASCDQFRSHFGQNVISSLSMPMVSNRPYSFLVIVFTPEVIGQTLMLTRHSQNHNIILVRSYNKTMDGLVIKKKLYFHSERKKKLYFHWDRKKKIVLWGKNPDPPLVMKWEAPKWGLQVVKW